MEAGWKMQDGGRLDVLSHKGTRRVLVEYRRDASAPEPDETFTFTVSEARAVSSALMGAAADV